MSDRVQQILGITPDVRRGVDSDRAAYLRGPETLEQHLSTLTRTQLEERYSALLTEATFAGAHVARRAWEDFERAEQHQDDLQVRRGGNR